MATLKLTANVRRGDLLRAVYGVPAEYPGDFGNYKIPADEHKEYQAVVLTTAAGETFVAPFVTIYPSRSPMLREARKAHRVYVVCPNCGSEVPAGRLKQHCGSKSCDDAKADALQATIAHIDANMF